MQFVWIVFGKRTAAGKCRFAVIYSMRNALIGGLGRSPLAPFVEPGSIWIRQGRRQLAAVIGGRGFGRLILRRVLLLEVFGCGERWITLCKLSNLVTFICFELKNVYIYILFDDGHM